CEVIDGVATCACEEGYAGVLCQTCAVGYQDKDGDSVCRPGCEVAGLDCSANGRCVDTSGIAVCVCDEGHEGADCRTCTEGFQDHDGDGTCAPACGTVTCGAHALCDDSAGTAVCT